MKQQVEKCLRESNGEHVRAVQADESDANYV